METPDQIPQFLGRLIKSKVRPREAQILHRLLDGPQPLGDLGRQFDFHKSHTSRITSRLAKMGFMDVTPDEGDPRKKIVALSKGGREKVNDLFNP